MDVNNLPPRDHALACLSQHENAYSKTRQILGEDNLKAIKRRLFGQLSRILAVVLFSSLGLTARSLETSSCNELLANLEAGKALRNQTILVKGDLSSSQQRQLTSLLVMIGIRRSKLDRLYQLIKERVGLRSSDHVPIIPAHSAENEIGDAARILVRNYNSRVEEFQDPTKAAYDELVDGLFALYARTYDTVLTEPWFQINGQPNTLTDFIREEAFVQDQIQPKNDWMNVVRLAVQDVQNPMLKGLVRDMWWNRDGGINPLGTVRISRNLLPMADGEQKTISVEVLRKGEAGFYIPYLFELSEDGQLQPAVSRSHLRQMVSCFQCHERLSGIFFGGISMPGYKAVDYWHVNAIDFTRLKYYRKFAPFFGSR